jgi:acetyl-CoA carboxylase carboxyltransferase component
VNKDIHLIFEAYTSQGVPAVSIGTQPKQVVVAPVRPPAAENEEKKEKKEQKKTLEEINKELKAVHAAYEIVDAIYKTVDTFQRATDIIQTVASVHRNERKRQLGLGK